MQLRLLLRPPLVILRPALQHGLQANPSSPALTQLASMSRDTTDRGDASTSFSPFSAAPSIDNLPEDEIEDLLHVAGEEPIPKGELVTVPSVQPEMHEEALPDAIGPKGYDIDADEDWVEPLPTCEQRA